MKVLEGNNIPLCIFACFFFAMVANGEPECPPGYTGLLPFPGICEKYLQCDRGGTFTRDCGPGTAFNPAISVCDWPSKVPGCSEDRPAQTSEQYNGGYGSDSRENWYRPNQYEDNNYGGNQDYGNGGYGWIEGGQAGHGIPPTNGQYGENRPSGSYYNEYDYKQGSKQNESPEMDIDVRFGSSVDETSERGHNSEIKKYHA